MSHECPDVSEKLSSYLDGELNLADARIVEQHLAECSACNALFIDFKEIQTSVIESFYQVNVPLTLDESILRVVLARSTRSSKVIWNMTTALTFVMSLCAVVVILSFTRFGWTLLHLLTKLAIGVMNIGPLFGWWTALMFVFSGAVILGSVFGIRFLMRFPLEGQPRPS